MSHRDHVGRSLAAAIRGRRDTPLRNMFLLGVIPLVLVAGCSKEQTADAKIDADVEAEAALASSPASQEGARPVAVVEESEAYLGILDPTEKVEKLFAIRNEGDAPLTLSRGGTSCKCTMSTLPDEAIQPGAAAVVRVSTKSEVTEGRFDHNATILTNDPKNSRITLRIHGAFAKVVAFDPPRLVLNCLSQEKCTTVDAVMYSQYFRNFDLTSIESSMEGLSWEVEPADKRALDLLEARCGYRLRLTFPPTEKAGQFWDTLQVTARSDDSPPDTRKVTWQIAGSAEPRAKISGKKFGADKVLRFGSLRRWQGAKERLALSVHDDHRNLKIEAIEKDPRYLDVEVLPMNPEKPESGLYWVNVSVPKDAPACSHMGNRQGSVRILSDHPALPVMSFHVQFAVTGS